MTTTRVAPVASDSTTAARATFRVGRKLRVPTLPLLRLLGVATDNESEPA